MLTKSRPTEKSPLVGSESRTAEAHPTPQEIARRAYEIYIERGGADGHDVDDWLQAEREQAERDVLFEKYASIGRIAKAAGA
jgi:hypothetical protein